MLPTQIMLRNMPRMEAKDAQRRFLFEVLMPELRSTSCPPVINVAVRFEQFLIKKGHPKLKASEDAANWLTNLEERFESALDDWEDFGLGYPACPLPDPISTYVTWSNPKYHELVGFPPLPTALIPTVEWLDSLGEREFLYPVAVCLADAECDPIYITDKKGDGGIDLIGRVRGGHWHGQNIFVQVKSGRGDVARKELLFEYGKFRETVGGALGRNYLTALRAGTGRSGGGLSYMFFARGGFQPVARSAALALDVQLRNSLQLASLLCHRHEVDKLKAGLSEAAGNLMANTSRNFIKFALLGAAR